MGETLYEQMSRSMDEVVEKFSKKEKTHYIAGDLLSMGAKRQREYEAEQLRSAGLTLYVPHEDGSINDKANADQNGLAERIVANDTQGLIESDVVVIDAHENGKGTLVELGQLKGMRDMANEIVRVRDLFRMKEDREANFSKDENEIKEELEDELEAVYDLAVSVLKKKVYPHNTDIRRANTQPQSGDRREYAPNQYVYGTVLDLTEGYGFYEFDEIVEELRGDSDG